MNTNHPGNKNSYRITGYIAYNGDGPGFITPLFGVNGVTHFVQVLDYEKQVADFKILENRYSKLVQKDIQQATITKSLDIPIYGFKYKKVIQFLPLPELKNYLLSEILALDIPDALVFSFIQDQKLRASSKEFGIHRTDALSFLIGHF